MMWRGAGRGAGERWRTDLPCLAAVQPASASLGPGRPRRAQLSTARHSTSLAGCRAQPIRGQPCPASQPARPSLGRPRGQIIQLKNFYCTNIRSGERGRSASGGGGSGRAAGPAGGSAPANQQTTPHNTVITNTITECQQNCANNLLFNAAGENS